MRLQIRTWETNGLYVMLLYQLQCDIASKRGGVYREPTSELPGDGVRVDVGLLKCTFQDPTSQNHVSESLAVRSGNLPFRYTPGSRTAILYSLFDNNPLRGISSS